MLCALIFLPNNLERTLVLMFMILGVHGEISGHLSISSVIACSSDEVGSEADSMKDEANFRLPQEYNFMDSTTIHGARIKETIFSNFDELIMKSLSCGSIVMIG